jgi:hypothetical protein
VTRKRRPQTPREVLQQQLDEAAMSLELERIRKVPPRVIEQHRKQQQRKRDG